MSKKKQKKTIAMAWWGTGGHVFPIRSLLETFLKSPSYASQVDSIIWFGSTNSLEQQTAKEFWPSILFQPIFSGKFRRQKSFSAFLKNVKDLFLFSLGWFQSLRYLKKYHVDTVFCKGGYVALPVVFASRLLRLKLIVHESDVHPWLVNSIASKYAQKTFTGFEGVFPHSTTVGQILSDDIVPSSPVIMRSVSDVTIHKHPSQWHTSSITSPSPHNKLPTVFVMWGSQGSRSLYETFARLLQTNPTIASSFNFYITLWKLNSELKPLFSQKNIHIFDFLSQKEMGEVYQISDICLARGGTTSLAEQKLFNIKSIIVPIPRTHDQMDNAKRYVHHYQDLLLDQTSLTFLSEMQTAFLSLLHYQKPPLVADIFTEIQQAKKLIWTEILT